MEVEDIDRTRDARPLTLREVEDFAFQNKYPSGLPCPGRVCHMAWRTFEQQIDSLVGPPGSVPLPRLKALDDIDKISELERLSRELGRKDQVPTDFSGLVRSRIEAAVGLIFLTLEGLAQSLFRDLITSTDPTQRREALQGLFNLYQKFGGLPQEILATNRHFPNSFLYHLKGHFNAAQRHIVLTDSTRTHSAELEFAFRCPAVFVCPVTNIHWAVPLQILRIRLQYYLAQGVLAAAAATSAAAASPPRPVTASAAMAASGATVVRETADSTTKIKKEHK